MNADLHQGEPFTTRPVGRPSERRWKYVVVQAECFQVPLVCPCDAAVTHAELAASYQAKGAVLSAGFCDLLTGFCWGESVSLGKSARPDMDGALLRKYYAAVPAEKGAA